MLFRYGFGLRKQQQIVSAAGLGIGAAHIKSAEGMHSDKRPGAFAVDVQIADMTLFLCAPDMIPVSAVNGPGQPVFAIVGDPDGILKVFRLQHGQHRAEDFFPGDSRGSDRHPR